MPLGNLGKGIKDSLLGTIKGAGDVVATTLEATKDTTVKALQGVRDVSQEASTSTLTWKQYTQAA